MRVNISHIDPVGMDKPSICFQVKIDQTEFLTLVSYGRIPSLVRLLGVCF